MLVGSNREEKIRQKLVTLTNVDKVHHRVMKAGLQTAIIRRVRKERDNNIPQRTSYLASGRPSSITWPNTSKVTISIAWRSSGELKENLALI